MISLYILMKKYAFYLNQRKDMNIIPASPIANSPTLYPLSNGTYTPKFWEYHNDCEKNGPPVAKPPFLDLNNSNYFSFYSDGDELPPSPIKKTRKVAVYTLSTGEETYNFWKYVKDQEEQFPNQINEIAVKILVIEE
jgi:hypothetical protein